MNKKILLALGCATLLVCGCDKKVDEQDEKKLYSIVPGEKYELYSHLHLYGRPEYQNENDIIDFSYPQINIDSDEIRKVNESIRKSYEEIKKYLPKEEGNGCICIKSGDRYLCNGEHLKSEEYGFYETEKYLTIELISRSRTYCAGGGFEYTIYTLDKEAKRILSIDEILNAFKFNKNTYEQAVKNKYNETYGIELDNFEYVEVGIYNNDSLIVVIPGMDTDDVYTYDGKTLTRKNSW